LPFNFSSSPILTSNNSIDNAKAFLDDVVVLEDSKNQRNYEYSWKSPKDFDQNLNNDFYETFSSGSTNARHAARLIVKKEYFSKSLGTVNSNNIKNSSSLYTTFKKFQYVKKRDEDHKQGFTDKEYKLYNFYKKPREFIEVYMPIVKNNNDVNNDNNDTEIE
jgi:hypothetical protein